MTELRDEQDGSGVASGVESDEAAAEEIAGATPEEVSGLADDDGDGVADDDLDLDDLDLGDLGEDLDLDALDFDDLDLGELGDLDDDALADVEGDEPEPVAVGGFREGDFVFYPQIGHCDVGKVIHDEHTGLEFLELTPAEATDGNRVLVPVAQIDQRGIRHTGTSPGVIEEILGSDFEPTIEDAAERLDLITAQERDGTVEKLALALKRLHLRHEMKTITREEKKRRTRIRRWLVTEYTVEKDATVGQAQSAITRLLGKTMKAVREREREAARKKRAAERAARKQAAAEKWRKKRERRLARMRR